MKSFSVAATVAGAALFIKSAYADVDPIVISGSKFFYKTNGTQFFMKGIAYQQDYLGNGTTSSGNDNYVDPLADPKSCQRDIPYLVQLGTNTIRTYAIDPTQNHDECMNMLADAGIYVISDLSSPGSSIIRDSPTWNDDLYARYTAVVDSLSKYSNTLGFFAGNEVSNNNTNTDASAFVKAAVRDTKAYIKKNVQRPIGVGYATNDDAGIREDLANYFDCGNREDAIDFWGYNIYSWCGDSSYTESGYDQRTAEFQSYDVPVFFAEYGCNTVQPREFTEVGALYGDQMTPVWSGGIVYMYFQEVNDFGLVSVDGSSVSTLADFNALSSQIAKISPTGVNSASYSPTNTAAAACPSVNNDWQASSNLPPTPNQELCECMYNALTCRPNNVDDDSVGDLFGIVCGLGQGTCDGITANATTGDYGAYGMCNPQQQLGWALNSYYEQQNAAGNGASACDFSGSATSTAASSPTGNCAALISQAGSAGTGTVTSAPSGTGGSGSGSGSGGSGSGSTSGSSSSNAGVPGYSSSSHFGFLTVAAALTFAFVSGAGMILL
ncbi:1 3-beta-glucanosyltransferase gel4 [Cladophialophora chaetospira]|uniref:1,3-beta-glucanosyltransferase n=1 Tax=Cladophialophora chaetospira TaxID=386627 RepID=A0AA38WZJ5_9EURO|nr:1 3-beta-glucanosyltransferase gel4 [Cladophialophora chaetospira]